MSTGPSTPGLAPSSAHSSIASSLLLRAHPITTANQLYTERVLQRPLHIKPSSPPPPSAADIERATRRAERKRKEFEGRRGRRRAGANKGPLSAREKRTLGLHEIPRKGVKYATFEKLNKLWAGYIREVLGAEGGGTVMGRVNAIDAATKLTSADYHGALIEVVRSRCVSRVGVRGIVVKDSRSVFEIVTAADVVKIVPKEHTVFKIEVPLSNPPSDGIDDESKMEGIESSEKKKERVLVFELRGDQFQYRSADRANRKFKAHHISDL